MEGFNNGKELKRMVKRFAKGRTTQAEDDFLSGWDRYLDTHHDVFGAMPQQDRDAVRDAMLAELQAAMHKPNIRKVTVLRWLPYAAAIFIAVTVAAWLFRGDRKTSETVGRSASAGNPDSADILPGGNRAMLTLADGRTISLSEAQAGIVVGDGITYLDGSDVFGAEAPNTDSQNQLLTLTTPKGGTYQIALPDGSTVWLNAGSTLSYPSRFSEDAREVFLEGEAFFAVSQRRTAAGRLPFRVVTEGQSVEVLGTEFNLSAYRDEDDTKTTLVEGAVQVVNLASKTVSRLRPGEQGVVQGSQTQVRQVDTAPFTAWKSGLFLFRQTAIRDVMNQLSRWYDIDVHFEGVIPEGETFSGKMGRDVQLASVLDFLSGSGIDYRLEGRRLIIKGLNYR